MLDENLKKKSIKKIGLVLKPNLIQAKEEINAVVKWASSHSAKLYVDPKSELLISKLQITGIDEVHSISVLTKKTDIMITLGGDGTFIGVARHMPLQGECLLLGVNFGTLGYLTEVKACELTEVLDKIDQGEFSIGHRTMLSSSIIESNGNVCFSTNALNDIVIHKGVGDKLLSIDVLVSGQNLARFRADGLIIATPTGSTAYSLAAGGSIVHPDIKVILLTPICPHSLTIRPLIIPADSELSIRIPSIQDEVLVTADGQLSHNITQGDTVKIIQAPETLKVIKSPFRSYFDVLTSKINWGIPNRAD